MPMHDTRSFEAEAAAVFHALAQTRRLALFRALLDAGSGGISLDELRVRYGPTATLSSHLKVLRNADLLRERLDGRRLMIEADAARFAAVLDRMRIHRSDADARLREFERSTSIHATVAPLSPVRHGDAT
jgi:DNA-binding transcriptional ArsR family regulator